MTVELITGTPGAGKTCYAVAKRLIAEADRTIDVEIPGQGVQKVKRRIVVAGIKWLACEHERLPHTLTGEVVRQADTDKWNATDADGEPVHKRLPGDDAQDVEASLFNWWLWCRPGDLIVCDEVQFIIARSTLNKALPHYLRLLQVHRHYGVDFIFISQAPNLVDNAITKVVGLHRHVRKVAGSLRILYEWDHVSNTERIRNANKGWFRLKSRYFRLYKSTVAVVAPPKVGIGWMLMIPALLTAALVGLYAFTGRWRNLGETRPIVAGAVVPARAALNAPPSWRPAPGFEDVPKLAGCYAVREICRCIDVDGRPVAIALAMCRTSSSSFDGLVRWEPRKEPPARPSDASASAPPPSRPSVGPGVS